VQITELTASIVAGVARAQALVSWDDADRPPVRLFVEVGAGFREGFAPDPNGFLVAAFLPAWHAGERRVTVEGSLCPVLRDNLGAVTATLQAWYPELGPPPTVSPTHGYEVRRPARGQAVSLLSMGIDSLATLRANQLNLPAAHPASIRAVLLVDLIRGPGLSQDETAHQHRKRLAGAAEIAAESGLDAISVRTNVLDLDGDGWFFTYKWHGAAFASMPYFLSGRFSRAYLAASDHAPPASGWGSHPLLDTHYSCAHMQIEHHGTHMRRFEKVALVAEWPVALRNILVCQGNDSGSANCGACEKCIRTMTALAALGKLGQSRSFARSDVTPELLSTVIEYGMVRSHDVAEYYVEMVEALAERGRTDLATVIRRLADSIDDSTPGADGALTELAAMLPKGASLILVEDGRFHGPVDGVPKARYWGPPSDDATAIRELESLRACGARLLAFRPSSFWWLEHYPRLAEHLVAYERLPDDGRLIAFDLQSAGGRP